VQIIENLRKNLEEKYNVYMARTMLNNYLLPCQSNSIAARAYHHPVWIEVAGVSRTETRDHFDSHYCLVSVKGAKQFATVFADMSVIIWVLCNRKRGNSKKNKNSINTKSGHFQLKNHI